MQILVVRVTTEWRNVNFPSHRFFKTNQNDRSVSIEELGEISEAESRKAFSRAEIKLGVKDFLRKRKEMATILLQTLITAKKQEVGGLAEPENPLFTDIYSLNLPPEISRDASELDYLKRRNAEFYSQNTPEGT